jgi:DNA-binding LytR/AlgR family response regulator
MRKNKDSFGCPEENQRASDRDLSCSFQHAAFHGNEFKGVMLKDDEEEVIFVPLYQIRYVECQGRIILIYTLDGVYSCRTTISEFHAMLNMKSFIRISNSYIVNRFFVKIVMKNGRFEVAINGKRLLVSRSYVDAFKIDILETTKKK